MGFLHCEVLRIRSDCRHSLHTCKHLRFVIIACDKANRLQLLAPANEALTDECLTGPITGYPWVEGICLMAVFVLFFVELMVMRFARFGHSHDHDDVEHHAHHAHG